MRQGRAVDQMRVVTIEPNWLSHAEGSALVSFGATRVLCACSVEDKVPPFRRGSGGGWVTAEYALLPRSTLTRTPREVVRGAPGGRTHEIQRLIGRSLRAVVDLDQLGERSLWLDADVLEADGGTRTAAVTGCYVAMALAVSGLVRSGVVAKSPIRQPLAAVSVGVVDGEALLDLEYQEDVRAEVDMNVVLTAGGQFVEVQATAERAPFAEPTLNRLLALAKKGIAELLVVQETAIAAAHKP